MLLFCHFTSWLSAIETLPFVHANLGTSKITLRDTLTPCTYLFHIFLHGSWLLLTVALGMVANPVVFKETSSPACNLMSTPQNPDLIGPAVKLVHLIAKNALWCSLQQ
jgi:hypothetical protein